jgi:hypothetical protein
LDIQGERVDYLNVGQLTQRIFANTQHAKRIQSISGAAMGWRPMVLMVTETVFLAALVTVGLYITR